MRIPHHLVRSSSGLWSFRQRVPADLQHLIGRRLLKRTLRTNDLSEARLRALVLASRYAQAFSTLRDRRMDKLGKKEADELIARLTQAEGLKDLTLHRTRAPDGTVSERWQIDTEEDLRLFQQAQRESNDPLLDAVNSPLPPREFGAARAKITPITLADARDGWLASLQGSTLPKTLTIKKRPSRRSSASWGARPNSTRSAARTWPAGINTCGMRAPRRPR